VIFPLRTQTRDVDVIVAATLRDRSANEVETRVEINGHDVGAFRVSAAGAAEARLRIAASDVGRVLRAGYNRLSIVTSTPSQIAIHRLRIAPSA
jgi:hypothetical protein